MSVFREFEVKVLRLLVEPRLGSQLVDDVVRDAEFAEYDHSGVGYFLTVQHAGLPTERVVCHQPIISDYTDNVEGSFVVFVEKQELMLEFACGVSCPKDIRDQDVAVIAA